MHFKTFIMAVVVCIAVLLPGQSCRREPEPAGTTLPAGATPIPASAQRSGNATAGYQYLLYGDFIRSGIPLDVYKRIFGANSPDDLDRSGDSDGVAFRFNVVNAENGVKVVAPTCLTCHAETLNDKLIVGLGNNTYDYTADQGATFTLSDAAIRVIHGENSDAWRAYYPASRAYKAISPFIVTKVRGVNPADKIFATLSTHRRADDLTWIDAPQFVLPTDVVPTDVPAWWLMKKKNALYYNALGQGDFARLSIASGMLTMRDSAEARRMDQRFADLMAWIRTIEPPPYPYPVDQSLAQQGKAIFEKRCSTCHGTYGTAETYPNLLIDTKTVGTDPALAALYPAYPQYHTWYNRSWYAQGAAKAQLLPTAGYIAPPLDGIWATAPYLHNASVPTLDDLLNSPQRPAYWKRTFNNADYDPVKMGWRYTTPSGKTDNETYDTTLPGYGNKGHLFGDSLTPDERKALLEYLKTI
jgi:Cytochrome c